MAAKNFFVSQDTIASNQGTVVCLWDKEPKIVGNTGCWNTAEPTTVEGHCLLTVFDYEEQDALAKFFDLKPGKCKGFQIQPTPAKESK